jgi:hypothetical protein
MSSLELSARMFVVPASKSGWFNLIVIVSASASPSTLVIATSSAAFVDAENSTYN